jgi:hypothetical protein
MEEKEKTTIIIDCNNQIMIVSLNLETTNVWKPLSFIKTPSTLPLPTIESFWNSFNSNHNTTQLLTLWSCKELSKQLDIVLTRDYNLCILGFRERRMILLNKKHVAKNTESREEHEVMLSFHNCIPTPRNLRIWASKLSTTLSEVRQTSRIFAFKVLSCLRFFVGT